MAEITNWVQRKAMGLRVHGPNLWNEIRGALRDACGDFNARYCDPNKPEVRFSLENGSRIIVVRTIFADGKTTFSDIKGGEVHVDFNSDDYVIKTLSTKSTGRSRSYSYQIASDEHHAYIKDKKDVITVDELSRRILEPVLFWDNPKRKPIAEP